MKRIILHIGTPKTGTTALQGGFLKRNKSLLEKNGIGYFIPNYQYVPWPTHSNGDFLVYDTLIKCENQDHSALQEAMQINTADHYYMLDTYINKARKNIDAEMQRFKAYAKDLDTIILSEEVFYHSEVFFPAFWPIIQKTLFDLFGKDIQIDIVLYLRRQDLWIESKFKEGVMTRVPWKLSFEDTIEEYFRIGFFDYNSTLERLEKTFGDKHILVRNYQRSSLIRQDIVYDFMETCQLSWDPLYQYNPDELTNPSLGAYSTYALDYINRYTQTNPILKNRLYKVSNIYIKTHLEDKNHSILTLDLRKEILERCKESNTKIIQKYTDKSTLFDATIKEAIYIAPDENRDKKLAHYFIKEAYKDLFKSSKRILSKSINLIKKDA